MQYLIHHMLSQSAAEYPHCEALVTKNHRINYQDLATQVANAAGNLRELGVNRGDRIAIFLPPDLNLSLAIFATAQARLSLSPFIMAFSQIRFYTFSMTVRQSLLLPMPCDWNEFKTSFLMHQHSNSRSSTHLMIPPLLRRAILGTPFAIIDRHRWTSVLKKTSQQFSTPQDPRGAPKASC